MSESRRRVLDPVERVSEVLFGLIMVLTFTGSMSAASVGRAEVREMLVAALGCNLAWGIVDAVMYLLDTRIGRARGVTILKAVHGTSDPEQGRAIIATAIDPLVVSLVKPAIIESIRLDVATAAVLPDRSSLTADDLRGAAQVCLLVFLSTLPVTIPFVLFGDVARAMRVSNAIAVTMLGVGGYSLGTYSGLRPWPMAAAMTAIGVGLVGITIALGG